MIYAWQRSPWNHIRLSCMCQTGNNKGRKAPSWLVHIQASLNLGRILLAIAGSLAGISRIRRTSACQQQLMSMATCTHASRAGWAPWRKRQPTESEWQSTPSQRPSTGSAHPNRKHHRGDKEHQPATTPNTPATASMLAMRAAQSETMPPSPTSSPAVFYSYWSFCSPIIPFPVMRPFLWSVAAGNPIRSSWKQPNIRHLNPRQTTLGNSMELHHDPFLSFALSGYNHEWYGTVHAHHASLSFPICMENIFGWHSIHHPFPTRRRRYHYMRNIFTFASMLSRIIHGCIQETLPYRISVYRKQAGNSETKNFHAEDTER